MTTITKNSNPLRVPSEKSKAEDTETDVPELKSETATTEVSPIDSIA